MQCYCALRPADWFGWNATITIRDIKHPKCHHPLPLAPHISWAYQTNAHTTINTQAWKRYPNRTTEVSLNTHPPTQFTGTRTQFYVYMPHGLAHQNPPTHLTKGILSPTMTMRTKWGYSAQPVFILISLRLPTPLPLKPSFSQQPQHKRHTVAHQQTENPCIAYVYKHIHIKASSNIRQSNSHRKSSPHVTCAYTHTHKYRHWSNAEQSIAAALPTPAT